MNPFRSLVDLALELRKEILYRYVTDNPPTQEEAAATGARLRALAADCRVAARRMGCGGGEKAIDTLLQTTVELFNAPAQLRDPFSRANCLAAAVPPVSKLVDDYEAELRRDRPTTVAAGGPGQGPARHRTGRPRKGESDKELLVIGALVAHHKWQPGGSVGDDTPAKTRRLAELASGKDVGVSVATVSRFFQKKFPDRGYKGYKAACLRGEIGSRLAVWQGEVTEHLADLLPPESGRGEDE
jgi:hypothetical protein